MEMFPELDFPCSQQRRQHDYKCWRQYRGAIEGLLPIGCQQTDNAQGFAESHGICKDAPSDFPGTISTDFARDYVLIA